ncbi:MAG: hypothetical protein COB36_13765 [Alphaproteobacteria bacterium]|nr:MAG: hypothetical protein COB36_13765 [Alphaproteobacteria bacterium]
MNSILNQFCIFFFESVKAGGWPPLIVFIIHVIASKIFDAYNHFPALDIPMHFIGGMVICYLFWKSFTTSYADIFLGKHTKISLFLFLVAATGTTTVLWEFSEWLNDTYFNGDAQVSVRDTMGDMFLGLSGGFVVSSYAAIKHKSNI